MVHEFLILTRRFTLAPKGKTLSLNAFNATLPGGASLAETLPSKPGGISRINDYYDGKSLGQGVSQGQWKGGANGTKGDSYKFGSPRGVGEWGIFEAHSRDGYKSSYEREYDDFPPRCAEPAPAAFGQRQPPQRHYWQADSSGNNSQTCRGLENRNNMESLEQECPWNQPWNESEAVAKAAMAKLTIAGGIRSSLLASPGGEVPAIPPAPPAEQPVVQPADVAASLVEGIVSDPEQRCRSGLLPKSKPPSPDEGSKVPDASNTTIPASALPAASNVDAAAGMRPKLQLLPRSKPPAGSKDSGAAGAAAKPKPSIFGAARPREEVLRERGVDPSLALGPPPAHASYPLAADGYRHISRPGSVHSGTSEEGAGGADQWQVISNGRPRAPGGGQAGAYDELGPFFGGQQRPMPHRPYGGGAYDFSAGSGHAAGGVDDDDGPMFKRALPTRHDLF